MRIFLAPHNDDETLFGAFTLLEHQPHVVVCLRSQVQEDRGTGITWQERVKETELAMGVLGCDWEQWAYPDVNPDWDAVEDSLDKLRDGLDVEEVFAPVPELHGHVQHNAIGQLAENVFGRERVTGYYTYTTIGRSHGGLAVIPEPEWIVSKLCALACYQSQIREPSTRPHFVEALTEYREPS